jgi:nucleoside-diphosphate-sugar epimerase
MPPTIYGQGKGLFNRESMQIPDIIRAAIKAGVAEYIGDGSAFIGHVHVEDLALLYELLLSKVVSGQNLHSGRRGIYFADTGAHNWRSLAAEVGKAGFTLGALKSAVPRSVSLEEAAERWFNSKPRVVEMNYASR